MEEGLCKRTKSSWGSWAFPTKTSETRDSRIVLDYRKANTRLVRSLYYIRRCEDVNTEAAGSIFYSALDGQQGYNLLGNTPYAKEVLAISAEAGCFTSEVLSLGPTTGPFDFQYVADELFTMGPRRRADSANIG